MSRARNIKPGFFANEELAECQPLARLLFAGLWCAADREGRLEDRPKRLKKEILGYDDCDVEALLSELVEHGFIVRYEAHDCKCIAILAFAKHQNPHAREQASTIPAPVIAKHNLGDDKAQPKPEPAEKCTGSARLIPDSPSLIPDSKERTKATVRQAELPAGFDAFWKAYPRKQAKADAAKAWKQVSPDPAEVMPKLAEQAARDDAWLRGFIPLAGTYLRGGRWNDDLSKPPTNGSQPPSRQPIEPYRPPPKPKPTTKPFAELMADAAAAVGAHA